MWLKRTSWRLLFPCDEYLVVILLMKKYYILLLTVTEKLELPTRVISSHTAPTAAAVMLAKEAPPSLYYNTCFSPFPI